MDDVIRKANQGDQAAITAVLANYHGWILAIVRRAASNELLRFVEPEDIVARVSGAAFKEIGTLSLGDTPRRNFEAWLRQVTTNAVLYYVKKRRRVAMQLADEVLAEQAGLGPSPSRDTRKHDRLGNLADAIGRLPETYKVVYELKLRGHTHKRIAAQLELTEAAVNSRCERGRPLLREFLGSTSQNLSSM